jgi:hypothetical protein
MAEKLGFFSHAVHTAMTMCRTRGLTRCVLYWHPVRDVFGLQCGACIYNGWGDSVIECGDEQQILRAMSDHFFTEHHNFIPKVNTA